MAHEALRSFPAVAIGVVVLLVDAAAQLPILAQPLPSPTPPAGPGFGVALATGDVNGDGLRDVIAGAFTDDSAGIDAGRVFVFLGPGLSSMIPLLQPVPEPGGNFGWSVASGDVNGDGFDDVLVGAPGTDTGAVANAGAAFVFLGPGLTTVLPIAEPFPGPNAVFGSSIASGDIDGNGLGDVIVGAHTADVLPVQDAGQVFVFLGPGLTTVLPLAEPTPEYGARFGGSVSAGDVDGDGLDDVLVGAPFAELGPLLGAGEAFVFLGPGLGTVLPLADPTPQPFSSFGSGVTAGDVNGDGFDEVIAGAPSSDGGGVPAAGETLVFLGPALTQVVPLSEPIPELGAWFGLSVATADVDGNGFQDVIVGAPFGDVGGLTTAGETFVFLGPGFTSATAPLDPTPEDNGFFGRTVAAGDFNGDGSDDIVVGAADPAPGGVTDGGEAFLFVPQFDLGLNSLSISASVGGTVVFSLEAGAANAGRPFLLAPSATGTSPCFPIGSVCLPVAVDAMTLFLLQPATAPAFAGTLDAVGGAARSFPVPPGLVPPSAVGLRLFSAYLLGAPFDYASRPVAFEFGP